MKTAYAWLMLPFLLGVSFAEPTRVLVLNAQDQTGAKPDEKLGGQISTAALADKALLLLTKQLVNKEAFVLIDRREYLAQEQQLQPKDLGDKTPVKPSFIQAAQVLNADAVLRLSLMSFSTGKEVVDQGGIRTEFTTLSTRVGLEALDSVGGTVIAACDGSAVTKFRQTASTFTTLSEDDALKGIDDAISKAVPELEKSLSAYQSRLASRPKVKLTVKSSADPALVEIDGILVGTTPIQNLEIYTGDHVLAIGKPGYINITKRIAFDKDTSIEVPMLRTEMSAEEWKEVLPQIQMNPWSVIHPSMIIKTTP